MPERAVFLDKDGTLIEDVPYNVNPARVALASGAAEALRPLQAAGYRLIVVSNQSGVARGLFAEDALQAVEQRVRGLLAAGGVTLDGFYYCPHHPEGSVAAYRGSCLCRKPAPGMLVQAAADHDLDLAGSWLIGDILDDVETGRRAGCRTVLLDTGSETEWQLTRLRLPHHLAKSLPEAGRLISCLAEWNDALARGPEDEAAARWVQL